jgi:hypothetical protein
MVALCVLHHGQADAGAFTRDQLRAYKDYESSGAEARLRGQFQWRRERLILLVGGNWWTGCGTLIQCGSLPIIWLTRDSGGYELLNLDLYDDNGISRLQMRDNDWLVDRDLDDLECTTRKADLEIKTKRLGAELSISFSRAAPEAVSAHALRIARRGDEQMPPWVLEDYRPPSPEERAATVTRELLRGVDQEASALCRIEGQLTWPVAVLLEPAKLVLPGNNVLSGGMMTNCRVGVQLN